MKYADEIQEGIYSDSSNKNGFVRIIYSNGDYYIGKYKNGLFDGLGTMTYANGSIQKGNWEKGAI